MKLTNEEILMNLGSPVTNVEISIPQMNSIRKEIEQEADVFFNKRVVEKCKEVWEISLHKYTKFGPSPEKPDLTTEDKLSIVSERETEQ